MREQRMAAFPLAFIGTPLLFMRASLLTKWRGGVRWRGTFYSLNDLRENQRMKLGNLVFSSSSADAELKAGESVENEWARPT